MENRKRCSFCSKCGEPVYAVEEFLCLDKVWHKNCFKCYVCEMPLALKTFKEHNRNPYCVSHYPKNSEQRVYYNPKNSTEQTYKYKKNVQSSEFQAEQEKTLNQRWDDSPVTTNADINSKLCYCKNTKTNTYIEEPKQSYSRYQTDDRKSACLCQEFYNNNKMDQSAVAETPQHSYSSPEFNCKHYSINNNKRNGSTAQNDRFGTCRFINDSYEEQLPGDFNCFRAETYKTNCCSPCNHHIPPKIIQREPDCQCSHSSQVTKNISCCSRPASNNLISENYYPRALHIGHVNQSTYIPQHQVYNSHTCSCIPVHLNDMTISDPRYHHNA